MNYQQIINHLAEKENVSVHEIEEEMQKAINGAGLNCSPNDFIKTIAGFINKVKCFYQE